MNTGWLCPRCEAVNAPGVEQCPRCIVRSNATSTVPHRGLERWAEDNPFDIEPAPGRPVTTAENVD